MKQYISLLTSFVAKRIEKNEALKKKTELLWRVEY